MTPCVRFGASIGNERRLILMAHKHDDNITKALADWTPDMDVGIAARAASFLDHAARKRPGHPISWSLVTLKVMGGTRMPNPDNEIVRVMMRRAGMIRDALGKLYGRGLENISGLGVRATSDADDFVATQIKRKAKRARAATESLAADVAKIDVRAMKNKQLRGWMEDLTPALASHNARLSKLLLPPGPERDAAGPGGGSKK